MDKLTRNLVLGFAGGLAAAAVFPFVKPVFDEVARPLAKVVLKQSMLLIDRLKTVAARAAESMEDLFAEVHAEVETELREAELEAREPNVVEAINDQPGYPHAATGELHLLRDSQLPEQPLRGAAR